LLLYPEKLLCLDLFMPRAESLFREPHLVCSAFGEELSRGDVDVTKPIAAAVSEQTAEIQSVMDAVSDIVKITPGNCNVWVVIGCHQ
jgi:hypothetical protein